MRKSAPRRFLVLAATGVTAAALGLGPGAVSAQAFWDKEHSQHHKGGWDHRKDWNKDKRHKDDWDWDWDWDWDKDKNRWEKDRGHKDKWDKDRWEKDRWEKDRGHKDKWDKDKWDKDGRHW